MKRTRIVNNHLNMQEANNKRFLITSATSIRSSFEYCPPGMRARLARQTIARYIRNYATVPTNDPSKIRNIALVAHIGATRSWLLWLPKFDSICRFREDHFDRVNPPRVELSLRCWICGHRKHYHRFLTSGAGTRDHHPVR